MAESHLPVDLFNPGQVFACIGLCEAAESLLGNAEGAFDWSDPAATVFRIRARGDEPPVTRVMRFLDKAGARASAPVNSPNIERWNDAWGDRPLARAREDGYPFPDPPSPATLICHVSDGDRSLTLDHWGDATDRDSVKFWAGAGGYPGAALANDSLSAAHGRATFAAADPFAFRAPQSSSFRLDWRRDYIPIHSGFSLNAHSDIDAIGFPLVELLGALGLTHARPFRPDRRSKLVYAYAVIGTASREDPPWLPLPILRAAIGTSPLPFPMRHFKMRLDWPGQEGQARSITTVTEETLP
jgi:CRISPR-associated protein Csb3